MLLLRRCDNPYEALVATEILTYRQIAMQLLACEPPAIIRPSISERRWYGSDIYFAVLRCM